MFHRHTTSSVGANRRLDHWNMFASELFPGISIDGPRDFEASWTSCRLGDFGVSFVTSPRATVRRWASGSPQGNGERGKIHFQSQGYSSTEQHGQHAALFAGDLTFCAPDEPYAIEISERNAMFVIDFPWAALQDYGAQPGLVLRHQMPSVGVLRAFVGSIFAQNWHDGLPPAEGQAMGDVLQRLLANALRTRDTAPANLGLRERMLAFIEANLGNGALRTGSLAQSLGVPAREVQTIFAEMATTASDYITTRRLTLAAHRLRNGLGGASLADLAYELGFSDAAHFSRRFRERFGQTPSHYAARCGG